MRLNIYLGKREITEGESVSSPSVCLAGYAHAVLDKAIGTAILLGGDSLKHSSIRTYRDVSALTTVVTF